MLMLVLLATLATAFAYMQSLRYALTWGTGRVLEAALVLVPALLVILWAWAFGGSFVYEEEKLQGGVWSTVGCVQRTAHI